MSGKKEKKHQLRGDVICGRIGLRIETAFSFAQIIDFCSYKKYYIRIKRRLYK